MAADPRHYAPATARNREPILAALRNVLPQEGTLLEVASGTGEHAAYFAPQFPRLQWQPSEFDPALFPSIRAHAAHSGADNITEPLQLDVSAAAWPLQEAAAMLCINMVHISPWQATEGLLQGAGKHLSEGGPLVLYGPYFREGVETAPSNLAFDRSLKERNPAWGIRRLEDVSAEAAKNGLALERVEEMPANNLTVIFRKGPE